MLENLKQKYLNKDILEVLKHAKVYFSADLATKALGFMSLPVFTRLMSESDYGVVSIFTASLALITILSTLNISDGIGRYYYEKNLKDFGEFLSSLLQFALVIQAGVVVLIFLFKKELFNLIGIPEDLVFFLVAGIFGLSSMKIYRSIHIARKESKAVARVAVTESYSGFGLSWILLVSLNYSQYILRITGFIGAKLISGIYMLHRSMQYANFAWPRWRHLKYALSFSLPRLPYVLSGTILTQFDRIMVGSLKGTGDAGLYSVAYNVGGLSTIFIGALSAALIPNFYDLMNQNEYGKVDVLNKRLFWLIVILGSALMLGGGLALKVLADERFHGGMSLIPPIVLGFVFYSLAGVYNRYVGFYKMTIFQSIAAITAGVVNVMLNYQFIPIYGIKAAAFTTTVSYLIQAIATWLLVRVSIKGHISPISMFILPSLLSVLICLLAYLIYS